VKKLIRRAGHYIFQGITRIEAQIIDRFFLEPTVPHSPEISHLSWPCHLASLANKSGMKVLEIGSRAFVRPSIRHYFNAAEYVGFDFHPGPNVDVAGDAHKLSTYFPPGHFDLIYSSASFEHFALPWVVATETAKLLKIGGYVFVETHFCFGAHERPWNFFNSSDMGLRALFPPALGFECVAAGMSNPLAARFTLFADKYLRYRALKGLYCHSQFLGKKVQDVHNFDWGAVDLHEVVGNTTYPVPSEVPALEATHWLPAD